MFSYNGDNGEGIPIAYDCQDTTADKAVGYASSNTLKAYATRLNIQLQHYLAGKPATDVYLVSHSLGGTIAFSYLAYLKSLNALDTSITGTTSRVKGVITLDSPIGGIAGGLAYDKEAFAVFAQSGAPCPSLQKHHITLSTAKQVNDIFQQARPPIGGTNSVMSVVFGSSITNQSLAEEAARDGMQILTVGNAHDFLFEPGVCNSSYENYLSSQWLADEGNTSGVYGRTFASGDATCTSLSQLDQNHILVLTDDNAHQAIEQLVDGRPVTTLSS
jgi:pimeloyl-ACP methyl ester carboxylesterase